MPKIAIAVLLIVMIVYLIATRGVGVAEKYIEGYWVGDEEFCEQSEVDSVLFYIGESSGWFRQSREAYLVICDDVISQALTLEYRRGWSSGPGEYRIVAAATFEDPEESVWPDEVEIVTDITRGTMLIRDPETGEIYLRATKNNEITNLTR